MACGNCGTGEGGVSVGCGKQGTCTTSGCDKMGVYDWLSNMTMPVGTDQNGLVEVRFKGTRKEFFTNKDKVAVQVGDVVAVEGSPGHDIGVVSMVGELVKLQLKKKGITGPNEEFKALYRKAKEADVEKWNEARAKEMPTMHRARELAKNIGLIMKLSDVEYQGDMKKATFYYTAEERVDFRELIKKMADEFKCRIEMRQIGMRQEAGRLGGIGSCGRELCCSTWLSDFRSVSTGAARYQNLSLNPAKLAGQCGKLKCCLNYELDSYLDALKDFPKTDKPIFTEKGAAFHRKTDIFKRLMWFSYAGFGNGGGEGEDVMVTGNNTWVAMPVARVKEIIKLNEQNIRPSELMEVVNKPNQPEVRLDYSSVVGQDSLTRFDKKKKDNRPQGDRNNDRRGNDRRRNNPPAPQNTAQTPAPTNEVKPTPNPNTPHVNQNPGKHQPRSGTRRPERKGRSGNAPDTGPKK